MIFATPLSCCYRRTYQNSPKQVDNGLIRRNTCNHFSDILNRFT